MHAQIDLLRGSDEYPHAFQMGFRPGAPTLHSLALLGVISIRISTRLHADYNSMADLKVNGCAN